MSQQAQGPRSKPQRSGGSQSQRPSGDKKPSDGYSGKPRSVKSRKGGSQEAAAKVIDIKPLTEEPAPSSDKDSGLSSPDMAGSNRLKGTDHSLDKWNPMDDDYKSPVFNSYSRPTTAELTRDFHGHNRSKEPELQLYVTGIPTNMDEGGLRNLFSSVGTVRRVKIVQSKNTKYSNSTFGFVTMSSTREVDQAIKKLHEYPITDEFQLRVSISDRNRQRRPALPYQKARRGQGEGQDEYPGEEHKGPYYRNIDREDLHREDQEDREISERSGHIKVHLRRSKSREDEDDVSGRGRREGQGRPRTPRDDERHDGSRDLYGGAKKPVAEKGVEGIVPTASDHMALLLGMQQLALNHMINSRVSLNPATLSSMINNSPMLSLFAPPVVPGTTASLEDVTTPPKSAKITNGRSSSGSEREEDAQRYGEDATKKLASIEVHVAKDGKEKVTKPKTHEELTKKHHKSDELRICIKCGQHGKKKCSVCQSAYCSAKCQLEDWPKHAKVCQQLKIEADALREARKEVIRSVQYDGVEQTFADMQKCRPNRKEMQVIVPYQENPGAFWVQIVSEENVNGYKALEKLMETTFSDQSLMFHPVKPQAGHVYACHREEDNQWYRSVVRNTPGDKIRVQFIDYGDEASVSAGNLRLLNKSMVQLPCLSFKCSLKGVFPTGGTWSAEAIERFWSLVADKVLLVNFTQPRPQDVIFHVTKMVNQEGVDVIKELIQSGFAKSPAPPSKRPTSTQPLRSPQDKPHRPPPKFSPQENKPSQKTPEKTASPDKPFRQTPSPTPLGKKSSPLQAGTTPATGQQAVRKSTSPLLGKPLAPQQGKPARAILPAPVWKTLKVKDRIHIEISAIESGGRLFYSYLAESAAAMADLQEKLQECYANSKQDMKHRYETDDMIAAIFPKDGQWYRARVCDASDMTTFFIDYGAETKNSLEECRQLQPQFTKLPPQCLDMCLDGVVGSVDAKIVEDGLKEWAGENQECIAEVMKVTDEGTLHVRLHNMDASGECLNDSLINKRAKKSNDLSVIKRTGAKSKEMQQTPSPDASGDAKPSVGKGGVSKPAQPAQVGMTPTKRKVGDCLEVAVVEVTGMTEIYACLLSDEANLTVLIEQLQQDYMQSRPGFIPRVGQMCVAMFDDVWYRALMKAKLPGNQFQVFYIDYGNVSEVKSNNCRELLPKYLETPPFAIRLHLENAREEDDDKMYSDAFKKWCENCTSVIAKLTGALKDKYLARIWKVDDESDCFNDILGDVPAYPPVPISPFVESVNVGDVVDILITEKQENPYLFYAVPQSQGEALRRLNVELQHECQRHAGLVNFRPEVGQLCCCTFDGPDLYRAVVLDVSEGKVNVFFIDWGNVAAVDVKECRSVPPAFLNEPMLAVRCRLEAVAEMAIEKVDMFHNTTDLCQLRVTRKDGDILVGVFRPGEAKDCLNGLPDVETPPANETSGKQADKSGDGNLGSQPKEIPTSNVIQHGSNPYKTIANPSKRESSQGDPSPGRRPNQVKGHHPQLKSPRGHTDQQKGAESSRPFIKASSLPLAPLPLIGKLLPASLTHMETLDEMYFHLFVRETLDILNAPLDDPEFAKLKDSMKEHHPQVGELCMAFVTQWCRAEVLRVSGSKYVLSILDYGFSVELGSDQLRPALPAFVHSKLACLKCALFGVQPLGKKTWTKDVVNFARNQLEVQQQSVMQIKVMGVDDVLSVEVYIPSEDGKQTSLAELLVSKGYAKEKLITSAPVVSVPHPPEDMPHEVAVHGVVSLTDFYLQVMDSEGKQLIEYIQAAVAAHCKNQTPNPNFKPAIKEACLAKFTLDNDWYRARVVGVEGSGQYKVQFIDYGNYDVVPSDHLLSIPAPFAEPCALAFPCCLSGFDKSNKTLTAGQLKKMSEALRELAQNMTAPYIARVVGTRDFVSEVVLTTDDGKDVGKELLSMLSHVPADESQLKQPGSIAAPGPREEPVMSELERLKAELAAKDRENRELKKLLNK